MIWMDYGGCEESKGVLAYESLKSRNVKFGVYRTNVHYFYPGEVNALELEFGELE